MFKQLQTFNYHAGRNRSSILQQTNFLLTNSNDSNVQKNPNNRSSRSYWCEIVQESKSHNGTRVYEDPSQAYDRLSRADNAEGINSRSSKYQYYEKPWMRRKRIKNEVTYRADKQKVDDLTRWIIFRQQNKLPIKRRVDMDDSEDDDFKK